MNKNVFLLGSALLLVLVLLVGEALALEYLDGRIRVKGRIEQFAMWGWHIPDQNIGRTITENAPSFRPESRYRSSHLVLNLSLAAVEGLFKLVDNEKLLVNLQTYFRYYYESSPDLDSTVHRMWKKDYLHRAYQTNRFKQDDWVNEAFFDIYSGPWNLRIGKQIIFWSEVEMVRTVDKINPIDMRYSTPGIEPWDEIKIGLWMIRAFYNSQLPGNLIFETIFSLDHQRTRTPFEGSWMGLGPGTPNYANHRHNSMGPGAIKQTNDDAWDDAHPAFTWSNFKFAFRIRGNSEVFMFKTPYVLDWTLSYINTLDDSAVAYSDKLAPFNGDLAVARVGGVPSWRLPRLGDYGRMWVFRRYELLGASIQTFVPSIKGVLRAEWSYEIGRPYNHCPKGEPDGLPEDGNYITERDHVAYGLTYDAAIPMPGRGTNWFTSWGLRPAADITLGLFQGWHLGDVDHIRQEFGYNQRSETNFTFMIRHGIRHNEFIPVIRALYNVNNWGYVAPVVQYMPGKHFRYELGCTWFWAKNPRDSFEATGETRDFTYFKVRYEF